MTSTNNQQACPPVGSVCKYTNPVDSEEAALRFVVIEAAPDAMPPRVHIRPLFWPWPIVPEETVLAADVTVVAGE